MLMLSVNCHCVSKDIVVANYSRVVTSDTHTITQLNYHPTVLQDGLFAALKGKVDLWKCFNDFRQFFKPKKWPFRPFLWEKLSKINTFGDFGCKKYQNLEKIQRSIINWLLEILMILGNFKPKNHNLAIFTRKIVMSKIHKIGDFGCKNYQNLKKFQTSIIMPLCRKLTNL